MKISPMRMLFLDTCALVKYFVDEPGRDVVKWLFSDEAVLGYSVHLMTSVHVRDEFPKAIAKMITFKQIPAANARGILQRADGYLSPRFPGGLHIIDTGPLPNFRGGENTSDNELIAKYHLKDIDQMDCAILASIVNYLRCNSGGSLPQVVTADKAFIKVIHAEGFGAIDLRTMTVEGIKAYLNMLPCVELPEKILQAEG